MNKSPQLDDEILQTLRDVLEADFPQLIETFVRDSANHLERIEQALEAQDSDTVRRAAHSFKGSASNVGAQQLATLCQAVEDGGRAARLDEVPERLEAVRNEREAVIPLLQGYI